MSLYLIENNGNTWFSLESHSKVRVGTDESQTQWTLEGEAISPLHAQFSLEEDAWWLEDLGSQEGTFLNTTQLQPNDKKQLDNGDRISFGFREFFLSKREPIQPIEGQDAPQTLQFSESSWLQTEAQEQPLFLLEKLSNLLDLKLNSSEFIEHFLSLLEEVLQPEASVLALEEDVHLRGTQPNQSYAELVLREARFQMKPLAFQSMLEPQPDQLRALYAPIFLEELARGYIYLLAPAATPWGLDAFQLFAQFARFASRSLTTYQALQRAQEDREVLHLNLVGIAPEMQALKVDLLRLARKDSPVFIQGEDGVGKSRIARAIHQASARRQAPMMVLNAANFPKELFEASICGSVSKDEQSPVRERPGKAQLAHKGTFLIEQIEELPLGIQPTLLALINSGRCTPVGSQEPKQLDVRVIMTSMQSLNELSGQDLLIPELASALEPNSLKVPPLRNRKEDIPQLFRAFLGRFGEEEGLPTSVASDEALALLKNHRWPQNIRELRRVVARCFYELDPERPVVDQELIKRALEENTLEDDNNDAPGRMQRELIKLQHQLIQEALMAANDDMVEAAKSLGISLVVLRRKMRELGIG